MAEIIRSSLSKVDIFGQNITLNMNKNASYTTAFGGFSSILIIFLLSIIFFSNIVEFFGKQNVAYDSEISFTNDPEQMIMNDENAMIALSIDQTNFSTNPFFNITVERKIYRRQLNGSVIKETIEIPMIPCTLDRFSDIFLKQNINFTDQFNFLSLGHMLCPDFNYTFSMQGTYSSEVFEFMKITVKDCENQTQDSLRHWNPICSSEENKTNYLNKNGGFKLQIYQINTVVNPQKADDYKSIYIDSDMYFSFVPKKLARLANVYYRQFLLDNDLSILPYEDIEQEKIIVRKAEDFRDLTELGRDTDNTYAVVYMRRSPFTEIIHRRYEKLGELLAYLGGFMQIMKVVFGFIIAFYNRTAMLVELSNKLYDFNDNSKMKKFKTMKTLRYTDHQMSSPEEKQDLAINQINTSSELQKVQWKDYVKQLIRKSKPITFNLKIFFNQLSFGYFFKNKNSEFLEKAMKKINTELDLHSILYQLQEINKLKQVLLRKSQIILFNFSPKPVVSLGEDQLVLSRYTVEDTEQLETYIKEKEDTPKEELFLKLEEAYKEIAEEIDYNKSNICQMNINLKLINLIGSDMKAILKPLQKKETNGKIFFANKDGDQNEQREEP